MIISKLMKNPILAIGILMMTLFIMELGRRGYLGMKDRKPTSCRAVEVMLIKRIPQNWHIDCNDNNLEITIDSNYLLSEKEKPPTLRPKIYRELANHLVFIAKNSPSDSLSRVFMITLKMNTSLMNLAALTEGQYLVKLSSITRPEFVAQHLKSTVQTQEKLHQ